MTKKAGRQSSQLKEEQLPKVESFLESTFKPVSPRPDFVTGLRNRLTDSEIGNKSSDSNLYLLLMIMGALAATVLLVSGLVRLLVELLGALSILRLANRQADRNKTLIS
jgi:hypothetical protein